MDLLQCYEALNLADNLQRLRAALDFTRQTVGAVTFSASRLYDRRPARLEDHVQNLPAAALREWLDPMACQQDPVMQRLKRSSTPIYWDRETYLENGRLDMWQAMANHGLAQGVCSVMHMPEGQHFVLGFDWPDADPRDLIHRTRIIEATELLMPFAESASRRVLMPTNPPALSNPLSPREVECLALAAQGKTAWETGQILGIGKRTANKHIESCVRKLGTSNRTHAVTTAIRRGIL